MPARNEYVICEQPRLFASIRKTSQDGGREVREFLVTLFSVHVAFVLRARMYEG